MTFISASTTPTVALEACEVTRKGDAKAPSFDSAKQDACPTVRRRVLWSSGVATHVAESAVLLQKRATMATAITDRGLSPRPKVSTAIPLSR
mmetsp:Transcript_7572/g.16938  ORF Transcript_7572/g.16938 Transcript_7572/m.16938 type:complete len:92 (+) Transcript_7572:532-807(+)